MSDIPTTSKTKSMEELRGPVTDYVRNYVDLVHTAHIDNLPSFANTNEEIEYVISFLDRVINDMLKNDALIAYFNNGNTLYKYLQLMANDIDPLITLSEHNKNPLSNEHIEKHKQISNLLIDLVKQAANDIVPMGDMYNELFRESPDESEQITQFLRSKIPNDYIIPNDTLAISISTNKELLFKNDEHHKLIPLKAGGKGRKQIMTYCCLVYQDDNFDEVYVKGFTAYDKAVHNSISTLYEAGNDIFTVDMVYRTMNGLTNTEKVSEESISKVTNCIDKMMYTKVYIDCTDEALLRKWHNAKQHIESPVISAIKGVVRVPSGTTTAYRLLSKPIIYWYSQLKNQVISIRLDVVETNKKYCLADGTEVKGIRNSDNIIVFREYMIRRIEGMKNTRNKLSSNRILFESLFNDCGIESDDRRNLKKHRDSIKRILDYWTHLHYIDGYEFIIERDKSIRGIDIRCSFEPLNIPSTIAE